MNNGVFYTYQSFSKGWYLIEIFYNGLVYAATKFGVGDVFIVAGQSNAQGVGDVSNSWQLPSVSGLPEWLVASNYDGNCTKNLPEAYSLSMYSISDYNNRFNRLGPTGNNVWCYAALGKLISDANSGMPVAFFNAASGGSTITTWYQGAQGVAAPNGYVGGNQFCLGYNGGSTNPTDYYGQPYTPLKTSLNYYASLFGVRGILWHQGEADADNNLSSSYKASSSSDYQTKLQYVISQSRTDFSNSNLTWFISNATISANGPLNTTIRGGQSAVATGNPNYSGPDTDYVIGSSGTTTATGYRRDGTHFEESYSSSLSWLADKWYNAIGSAGTKISGGFVPNITYSISGSTRTYTAPSGYASYIWGTSINSPIAGAK